MCVYVYVRAPYTYYVYTVCLASTKFLGLSQHFYPKGWRVRTSRLSSVINNTAMYDAACPPPFFQLFQSETAVTKCKNWVCMVKTHAKSQWFLLTPSIYSLAPENRFTQCWASQSPALNNSERNRTLSSLSKIIAKIFDVFLPYKPTFLHFVAAVSLWKSWKKRGGFSVIHRSIVYDAGQTDRATAPSFWVKMLPQGQKFSWGQTNSIT